MALKGLLNAPLRVVYEVGAIALEMLRIPLRLWLRIAEIAGGAVLARWRMAWTRLLALTRGSRRPAAVAAGGRWVRRAVPRRASA
jgi:hypothetical protein